MSGYNIKAIDAELECLNGRIADRNATIASQAAEIEELKNRLSVLDEFRVLSQNTLIAANEAHVEEMRAENASQAAQIERLSEALQCLTDDVEQYIREVKHAQSNGASWYSQGARGLYGHIRHTTDRMWEQTKMARAALQPKEGE